MIHHYGIGRALAVGAVAMLMVLAIAYGSGWLRWTRPAKKSKQKSRTRSNSDS